jgi:transketolase
MHHFGASAQAKDLLRKFGFTCDEVVSAAWSKVKDIVRE